MVFEIMSIKYSGLPVVLILKTVDIFLQQRPNFRDSKPSLLYNLLWDGPMMVLVIESSKGSIILNFLIFLSETLIIWLVIDCITIIYMKSHKSTNQWFKLYHLQIYINIFYFYMLDFYMLYILKLMNLWKRLP